MNQNNKYLKNSVTSKDIIDTIESLNKTNDNMVVAGGLNTLATKIKRFGLNTIAASVPVNSVLGYIYSSIFSLIKNGNADRILTELLVNMKSAFNDNEVLFPDKKLERESHTMSEKNVTLYNPSFDPGADTSTCVEINGKIAGLAFSVNGIQKILRNSNILVEDEYIRKIAAKHGILIAEDSDEVYSPREYAKAIHKAYLNNLLSPVCKGTSITYKTLVDNYNKMAPLTKLATDTYFKNKTDSQLRQMLLDVWMASNRPAKFNQDEINFMTREELIEAINNQERVPVDTEAMVESILKKADMTFGELFDSISDDLEESSLIGRDYVGLVDDAGEPVDDNSIELTLSTGSGVVQTPDGGITIEKTPNGFVVSNSYSTPSSKEYLFDPDNPDPEDEERFMNYDDEGYEEFTGESAIEEAIDYFRELLSRQSLSSEASLLITGAEVTNFKVPTTEEAEEAKAIINMEIDRRAKLEKLMADYTKKVREELGITPDSDKQLSRALEILLRKVKTFKRGMVKLADDRYAKISTQTVGGTQTVAQFRKVVQDYFKAEESIMKDLQRMATTPTWEKEFLTVEEPEKKKVTPFPSVFMRKEESVVGNTDAIMQEIEEFGRGLDEILRLEEELNNELFSMLSVSKAASVR